jgi:hypothetical protein
MAICLIERGTTKILLLSDNLVDQEEYLNSLRRYILIVRAPQCPAETYVSYFDDHKFDEHRGGCYYIDKDDYISHQNFLLVDQFLTMQAVPPQSAPLTPTISVGGNKGS